MSDIREAFAEVCERWAVPGMARYYDGREKLVLGISQALGDLFDGDEVEERRWLYEPREDFGGRSSIFHMIHGDERHVQAVADLVEKAESNIARL